MAMCYKKLRKLLIDRDMTRADLRKKTGISPATVAKMSKGETIGANVLQTLGNPRHWDFLGRDSYLVFRTRTRVDEYGNLVVAHHGKILGRWLSDTEFMILSDGCFNPVENDVNIEDGSCLRDVLRNVNPEQD